MTQNINPPQQDGGGPTDHDGGWQAHKDAPGVQNGGFQQPHPSGPLPYAGGYQQQPPYGYGQPAWGPGGYGPQTPQPSNGIATAGFVVALIGAVLSFIPIVGTVAWLLAPVGLVLSIIGLVKSQQAQTGRGKSIAGIVLAAVALIMCFVYTVAFAGAVSKGATNVQQQSATVHNVTYQVSTGSGSNVVVSYSQSQNGNYGSGSVTDVPSPWSVDTQVSGYTGPTVTGSLETDINNMNRSDTISCTIIEDGAQVSQNSATGPNASVSCSK
jgi:hypothetical protein